LFVSDQPIQSSSQDIIGRKNFARSVAETIFSYETTNELVLGLYGEWGSGKTSLLNLTVERIEELSKEAENKPIIIKFNPWNFSEQNQLITQYFSILSRILKRKDNSQDLIYIGEKLEEYSDIFDPLSIIPVVGQFTFIAKIGMRLFSDSVKLKGKSKKRSLDEIRKELNDLLKKIDNKIIVIIDDIDRLTPHEIRQIFQLVKKIADFPNTIYLLAFDKKVVLNALQEVHKGFENEYLEKIIQVPFEIPPISKEDMYQFLFKQIDKIIADLPQKEFDQVYWGNIFNSGIKYYFHSLRDVSRFTNILSFNYSLVKGRVNVIDFIAITSIQVFHSELYYSIRSNKDFFAGYKESQSRNLFNNVNKEKEYYNRLIPDHRSISSDKLEDFLSRLFPKLESVFGHSFFGASWSGEWRKKSRICSEECFDTYFKLAIDASELSQREMEIILSTAQNYETFKNTIIKLNKESRIIRFLELLEDYTSDKEIIPEENIQNIISILMDRGDSFPENENKSIYEFDTSMKLLRIFYQLSHRFDSHDSRFELFRNAIENASNSIYTIVHEVGVQDQQHGKYTDEKELPLEKVTVKTEQLEKLHELAASKIEEWSEREEFIRHNHLGAILYRWKEWKGIEIVRRFVEELISTDEGITNFVRAFLGRSVSYGISDYTGKVNWKINLRDIEEFIDLNKIEKRLSELNNNDLKDFSEKEKLAITTFFDFYNGKRKIND
jgi:predicted KAP-like P-loop ATPase